MHGTFRYFDRIASAEVTGQHVCDGFVAGLRDAEKDRCRSTVSDEPDRRFLYRKVRRRAAEAGFKVKLGWRVFLTTGSTGHLKRDIIGGAGTSPQRNVVRTQSAPCRRRLAPAMCGRNCRDPRASRILPRRSKPGHFQTWRCGRRQSIYGRSCQMFRGRKTVAEAPARQASPQVPKLSTQAASCEVPPNWSSVTPNRSVPRNPAPKPMQE